MTISREYCGKLLFIGLLSASASGQLLAQVADQAAAAAETQATEAGANVGEDKRLPDFTPARGFQHDPIELQRMQNFLDTRLERTAIAKSLLTAQGRGVDCVDLYRQPALKQAAMAGQPIELAPRTLPADLAKSELSLMSEGLFEREGEAKTLKAASCPAGTVPMLGVTLEDLKRFPTLDAYFAKSPAIAAARANPGFDGVAKIHYGPTATHQYAHAYRFVTNWGAQATINIWKPYTELNSEFSLGQIWVTGGTGTGLQTLEVGVQKYQQLYGNAEPHLFIYSTRDAYKTTGCYNNSCGDFVQVSKTIFPGMTLGPVSVAGGTQQEVVVQWYKDTDTGHWWLRYQGQWVGYYPRNLYNAAGVINRAAQIDFGGEIIDNRNGGRHTATDMGSGAFPNAGFGWAAYMRQLTYNSSFSGTTVYYSPVTGLTTTRSDALCYDIGSFITGDANWGSYFFYGGPGYSSVNCA